MDGASNLDKRTVLPSFLEIVLFNIVLRWHT